jgi:hypothetical protein
MIVKFKVDHEAQGRVYMAGQSHEFDDETARALISNGVAVEHDPESVTDTPVTPEKTPESETQPEDEQEDTEPKPHKKKYK